MRRTGARARAARTAVPDNPAAPERLQKVLARAGVASRREVEAWIRTGRLTVNGAVASLGMRILASDQVRLDGRLVRAAHPGSDGRALLCHRSPGEPLAALLERLPRGSGRRFVSVSPMPRTDGGLELVTADGELAVRLQRAAHALGGEFSVRVRGELSELQLQGIRNGTLDSGAQVAVERCEPAGGEAANRWYTLAVRGASGKQVRQLFERQGALVSRVLRTQLGSLTLDRTLRRGQFRELTQQQLGALISPER